MWIIYEKTEDLFMAFFDEIGRKLTQTGHSAIKKATEMADVAKLNAAISEEEKKITNAYYQIGQTYVDTHKNNIEIEFEILVAQINDSIDKIADLKRQIQDLKN